jgi:2-C-methyl-D-erythritol 2,4-cyclodiphosphate synthase
LIFACLLLVRRAVSFPLFPLLAIRYTEAAGRQSQSAKGGEQMQARFDKFTERARKVLRLAQEEAQRFNHNYIGTEHLLLGLVREGEGAGARVLMRLGVDLNGVRTAVEQIIGRGDRVVMGEVGLTPRAKRVIELAVDEARRLNHHHIGTEHLLLGLVRESEGIAAGVLESLGVTLDRVRLQTLQVLGQSRVVIGESEIGRAESHPAVPRLIQVNGEMIRAELVEAVAQVLARRQRLALAADACTLVEGRQLVLAGVTVDEVSKGPEIQHGDVVMRAIAMALLAATNRGEVDGWFPDATIASSEYLRILQDHLIKAEHLLLGTVDVTLLVAGGELLNINSRLPEMQRNIAGGLEISADQVHVKMSAIGGPDRIEARVLVSLWQGL